MGGAFWVSGGRGGRVEVTRATAREVGVSFLLLSVYLGGLHILHLHLFLRLFPARLVRILQAGERASIYG